MLQRRSVDVITKQKIRKLQRTTDFILPKHPIQRVVREIVRKLEGEASLKILEKTSDSLYEALEVFPIFLIDKVSYE